MFIFIGFFIHLLRMVQGKDVPAPFATFEATGFSSEILKEVHHFFITLSSFLHSVACSVNSLCHTNSAATSPTTVLPHKNPFVRHTHACSFHLNFLVAGAMFAPEKS